MMMMFAKVIGNLQLINLGGLTNQIYNISLQSILRISRPRQAAKKGIMG